MTVHGFCLILSAIILLRCSLTHAQGGLIGDAVEAFNPCDNNILTMERIIGGQPSKENYWDGRLYLNHFDPKLSEARITLQLDSPASINLDPEQGRVLVNGNTFHLSFFKPETGYKWSDFRVEGKPFGKFPNVKYLALNDVDVCPNPNQWRPTILGATNKGEVTDTGTLNDTDPNSIELSKCGRRLVAHQGLIKGGHPTNEGDWPWHAAIFHQSNSNSFSYKCGGTLLDESTVITAAHCVIENSRFIVPARVLVKLGLHNRLIAGRNAQEFQVFRIVPHNEFDFTYLRNDIAILKLATEVTFTNYVQPICLWPANETGLLNVVNEIGKVIGWGYFNEENKLSDYITEGSMPIVSHLTCLESNRDFYGKFVSDRSFCAGFKNGTSVCNGDSGGGMFLKKSNVYYLRGIVSLSMSLSREQVCNPLEFVIFTDVAQYLEWIEKNRI